MRADRFTALIDATVLGGALKRNIILTLAEAGFYRPRWSAQILDEVEKAIAKMIGNAAKAKVQRERIEAALPEASVSGFDDLIAGLKLPDPNDRHVLAAAIETHASVIITDNLKDFPADALAIHNVSPLSPDVFTADVIDLDLPTAIEALMRMRTRLAKPAPPADELILRIETVGMPQTASLLLPHKALL
jgi:predicted nucleic acid-binding protein